MIRIDELEATVDDIEQYEELANETIEEYCIWLATQQGMMREPFEDEFNSDYPNVKIWTIKASNLIDAEFKRLYDLAVKYFGKTDADALDISTSHYTDIS